MKRYDVPDYKIDEFTAPRGYEPIARRFRAGIIRTDKILVPYVAGKRLLGVIVLEECAYCNEVNVPVFGIRPHNGSIPARCHPCEKDHLLGIVGTRCAHCPSAAAPRRSTCSSLDCIDKHAQAAEGRKKANYRAASARSSFARRTDNRGAICIVCGGHMTMASPYMNSARVHGGDGEDCPPKTRGIGDFDNLVAGSCEHRYLVLMGGAHVTSATGITALRASIHASHIPKIISLWDTLPSRKS
jgi:hypothetical protein